MTLYFDDVDPFGAGLPWTPFTIPGSDPPVELVRLEVDRADGSSTSLVRFPPGWSRPEAGHYVCGEEFVVLAGGLTVSGVAYGPGDRGWIPDGGTRSGSRSAGGALAVAWFSGVPAWVAGEGGGPSGERTPLLTVPVPAGGLPLRSGSSGESRLYERCPGSFASAARVLWPDGPHEPDHPDGPDGPHGPRWAAYGPGDPVPSGRRGRAFVRFSYSI